MIRNALVGGLLLMLAAGCGNAGEAEAQMQVGQQWFSTRGHVACTDRGKLEAIIALVVAEDRETLGRILSAPPEDCFRLRPGLSVTVASFAEGNAEVIEVRPEGMEGTIWVVRQALVRTLEEIPPPDGEDTTATGG
jgi:hypothetical protein